MQFEKSPKLPNNSESKVCFYLPEWFIDHLRNIVLRMYTVILVKGVCLCVVLLMKAIIGCLRYNERFWTLHAVIHSLSNIVTLNLICCPLSNKLVIKQNHLKLGEPGASCHIEKSSQGQYFCKILDILFSP